MGSEAMKLGWMPTTEDMPQRLQAAKRTNIYRSEDLDNWWMGHGKDESCFIEGTANHWFWLAFTLIGLTKADECPYSEDAPLPYSKDYVCDAVKNAAAKDAEIERLKAELGKRCIAHGKMSATIVALEAQLAAMGQQAGNVLARIHGDGGHYITQHGWEKACVDADAVVCRLQAQLSASEDKRKVLGDVIREALEPGVFGYQDRTSLVCREDDAVIELCERFGYGAVMDSASRCWGRKTQANGIPGAEITIAACASVRKRWCEDAASALEAP